MQITTHHDFKPSATASATATVAEVFPSTATASATAQKSTFGRPLPLWGDNQDNVVVRENWQQKFFYDDKHFF